MVREAMVRKNRTDAHESSNFIKRAEMNGMRLVYIEEARLGVRKLRPPFIKVEDQSRK